MEDGYVIVELAVDGAGCPLVEATRDHDVVLEERPPAIRSDGTPRVHFDAEGDVDAMESTVENHEAVSEVQFTESGSVGTCRASIDGECLLAPLVDAGFIPHEIRIENGVERLWGSVPGRDTLADVIAAAREHGSVRLERATTVSDEPATETSPRDRPDTALTKRQRDAVAAAQAMGYFEVPREADATAVADELGISKSAFLDRLKRAQATLFENLFSDREQLQSATTGQERSGDRIGAYSDD